MAALEPLTEREIIIAQGGDPDAQPEADVEVATEVVDESPEAQVEQEAPTEPEQEAKPDEQSGKESHPTEEAPEASGSDWLDESTKQLGQSYGMTDEDMKSFKSADDFRRITRLFDQQLVKPQQAPPPKAEEKPTEQIPDLDPENYRKKNFDDDTIAVVTYARGLKQQLDTLTPQVKQMFDAFQMMGRQNEINQFHDAVDGLNDSRFGKTVDKNGQVVALTKEQDDARRRLYEANETLKAGLARRAEASKQPISLPAMSVLLQRARNMEFGTDIAAETKKTQAAKIAAQSKQRRPAANSRPMKKVVSSASPKTQDEIAEEIANDPEVEKLWKQFEEIAG